MVWMDAFTNVVPKSLANVNILTSPREWEGKKGNKEIQEIREQHDQNKKIYGTSH